MKKNQIIPIFAITSKKITETNGKAENILFLSELWYSTLSMAGTMQKLQRMEYHSGRSSRKATQISYKYRQTTHYQHHRS